MILPLPSTGRRVGVRGETVRQPLLRTGTIAIDGQTVRFIRPGLVEEYSVSLDGVRQDFVVLEKPGGASVPASRLASSLAPPTEGQLRVELAVTGARPVLARVGCCIMKLAGNE
jgi:hypothetical protein